MINFTIDYNKEKSFLYHSSTITLFSPLASLYQTSTLFNKSFISNLKFVPRIVPQQILLRYGQLHISTQCKDQFSPITAFGIIGILQGIVYGHSNLYFSKQLGVIPKINYLNYLRGPIFASSRDIISQGIPFALTETVRDTLFEEETPLTHYSTLFSLSIGSTILSHPLHCFQTYIQNTNNVSQ